MDFTIPEMLPGPARPEMLTRAEIHPDRRIRMAVGLRPFRRTGFRVEADRCGRKLVIHNYGHGGAGITLAWGTAKMAMDLLPPSPPHEVAVLGSGVIGLTTARLLQRANFSVTIYARDLPPETTSNIAGGYWAPVMNFDPGYASPSYGARLEKAARLSHRMYQNYVGDDYGVRWIKSYALSGDHSGEWSPTGVFQNFLDLFPDLRVIPPIESPFRHLHTRRFYSMLIEPPIYLNAMMRDFLLFGGRVEVREFQSMSEVDRMQEMLIFNCTGLGSQQLFGDQHLQPSRGQLSILLPQPGVNYATHGPGEMYMYPRKDGLILGATHDFGNWDLNPDPVLDTRILLDHRRLMDNLRTDEFPS